MYLLFDNGAHVCSKLIFGRVEEDEFSLDFLGRERAHSNLLAEEPFVSLSQLAQLDIHIALVDDVNDKVAQALVQFDAILLRETRLLDDFLLTFIESTIDSNFLRVHVKSRESRDQFFKHLVSLELWVLEHRHGVLVLS